MEKYSWQKLEVRDQTSEVSRLRLMASAFVKTSARQVGAPRRAHRLPITAHCLQFTVYRSLLAEKNGDVHKIISFSMGHRV